MSAPMENAKAAMAASNAPLDQLEAVQRMLDELRGGDGDGPGGLREAVDAAREAGVTWREIGERLNPPLTASAASARFGPASDAHREKARDRGRSRTAAVASASGAEVDVPTPPGVSIAEAAVQLDLAEATLLAWIKRRRAAGDERVERAVVQAQITPRRSALRVVDVDLLREIRGSQLASS